MGAMINRA